MDSVPVGVEVADTELDWVPVVELVVVPVTDTEGLRDMLAEFEAEDDWVSLDDHDAVVVTELEDDDD